VNGPNFASRIAMPYRRAAPHSAPDARAAA
jgi:hypothetical protein